MGGSAIVIDGNAVMYRAYFATQWGKEDAEAELNFSSTLSAVKTTIGKMMGLVRSVDYAVVAFDSSKENFRRMKFTNYKSNRKPMPKPLLNNLNRIRKVFLDLGIAIVDAPPNYEGDDAIATLASIFEAGGIKTCVFSTDKDLLQLVSSMVSVFLVRKSAWQKHTKHNFEALNDGLKPYQIPLQKALSGDSSDNYKGLNGVGPTTSRGWLIQYGDIENIYRNIDLFTPKHQQILIDNKEELKLFLELSSLVKDLDLSRDLKQYEYQRKNAPNRGTR